MYKGRHFSVAIFTVSSQALSILIEKDLREFRNISVKFACALFCAFHLETSSFFGKSFPLYSYF